MRLAEDQIKRGILHPERIVRDAAMRYFADSFLDDSGVMPLAIQAVEAHGWDDAFEVAHRLSDLAQTDETLLWLIDQLNQMGYPRTDHAVEQCSRLSSLIVQADVLLLMRHEEQVLGLEGMASGCRDIMAERLRLMTAETDACWSQLEAFCETAKGRSSREIDLQHAFRLVEAISRDESQIDRVLDILSRGQDAGWMEPLAVRIAAEMRMETAVPLLVDKLREDRGDQLNEQCLRGFVRIGTDVAVETIRRNWAKEPWHYRLYAAAALENICSDFAVAKCLELAQREKTRNVKSNLIAAALSNFASEGIDPARQFTLHEGLEVRRGLVAASLLTGVRFPEFDRWFEAEKQEVRQRGRRYEESKTLSVPPPQPKPAPPAFENLLPPTAPAPIVGKKKAGRNDPCPCQSGRKFKKCCGKNQ